MSGMRRAFIVKTGERSYCLIGEWESFDSIVSARAEMVGSLDRVRDLLEDLGAGLGVTDPVSGEVVLEMGVPPTRRSRSSPVKSGEKWQSKHRALVMNSSRPRMAAAVVFAGSSLSM